MLRRVPAFVGALLIVAMPVARGLTFVEIGNPGNPADSNGKGNVSYTFAMSDTEVSVDDYVEFLNAVADTDNDLLWTPGSSGPTPISGYISRSGTQGSYSYSAPAAMGTKPAQLSIPQMLRFVNWLHNDRPVGPQSPATTEDGAYTFFGVNSYTLRNPGARFWLPSENEWRKAAYYDPSTSSHRLYPHGSSQPVTAVGNNDGEVANPSISTYVCNSTLWGANTSPRPMSVGTSGNRSAYNVMDLGANAWEIFEPTQPGILNVQYFGGGYNFPGSSIARTASNVNNTGSITYAGFHVGRVVDPSHPVDTDNDGIPNNVDLDDDGDGVTDLNEAALGTNPLISDALFQKIRQQPEALELFEENDILDLRSGYVTGRIQSQTFTIQIPLETSTGLNIWEPTGTMERSFAVEGPQKFFRLRIAD